jgi:hypothetical protein
MGEWMTITILESGHKQRIRKSAISAYGSDRNPYVVKEGRPILVKETMAELKAELEDDDEPAAAEGAES